MNLFENILSELSNHANPKDAEGMARFGINPKHTLGIRIPVLREIASRNKKQHHLALELWETGIHEARILAGMVEDVKLLTEAQMEKWVSEFDSWDVCDQVIMNLFERHRMAWEKAVEWSRREAEFEKRAGFVMMARLAVSDKKAENEKFIQFFPLIIKECTDDRNMVKKAVNWAIRQIGKRNKKLNKLAIELCLQIQVFESKSARWIAADAIRELRDEKILGRIKS
jgi:3-methyladenine DNA glycosylase AlkD